MISQEEYFDGKVIYGINFARDLTDGCSSGHSNLIKRGSLRLEIHLGVALNETINVIMFCEFDNIIQIGEDQTVITDYN